MQNPVTRVLIVDDSAAVRAGLSMLLSSTPDLAVVGTCASGSVAVETARRCDPHVVLMDLAMPGTDGVAATAALRAWNPAARVLVLTTSVAGDSVHRARTAGAVGFVQKSAGAEALLVAIRAVAGGGTAWSEWAREVLRHEQ